MNPPEARSPPPLTLTLSLTTDPAQFLVAERDVLHITGSFMAVVKPCDGAGSEGVTVCKSEEQVR